MEALADRPLPCRDCSQLFTWTAGEQRFFREKGLVNLPARRPACRAARKARLGLVDRDETDVVCARCGARTPVPFVPRHDHPVYCARCFAERRAAASASPGPAGA